MGKAAEGRGLNYHFKWKGVFMDIKQIELIVDARNVISDLCDGYLDMPSACDGCPYGDTVNDDGCEVHELLSKLEKIK